LPGDADLAWAITDLLVAEGMLGDDDLDDLSEAQLLS
ncbi:MAG: hypothetical protein QOG45_927, partial [Chloroflexota bacterium]|nr:hypothetical protein [Chloroflexota bacterium]